jgi:hypothetical protein
MTCTIIDKIKESSSCFEVERSGSRIRFGLECDERAVQQFIDDG